MHNPLPLHAANATLLLRKRQTIHRNCCRILVLSNLGLCAKEPWRALHTAADCRGATRKQILFETGETKLHGPRNEALIPQPAWLYPPVSKDRVCPQETPY